MDLVSPSVAEAPLAPEGATVVMAEYVAEPTAERLYQAPLHRHHAGDEIWYVLEGALGFRFDGEEVIVHAGGAACARAGVAHTYWNASDGPTRYLLVMDRTIANLIGAIHDPETRAAMSLDAIFTRFGSELLDTTMM